MDSKRTKPSPSNIKHRFFWVTCDHCKKKIGVPPEWVFKYLERIEGYEHEKLTAKPNG